ncbi:oxidoreductase [Bacillus sp. 165]|uniref:oxidoreductase n=1 Tax=Bacillus sp. 165 TaxID=1529117 RepID=UPI001ADD2D53|nr:oxidoreductase [Bacillus sp. 165]MBO9130556.1 oxidoreductase [Bacillus sp. 165]
MKRHAVVLGATGLIGQEVVGILLKSNEYERVTVLVRNYLPFQHEKLEQVIINFDQLESCEFYFKVDDVYSCLGTTIKKAKSRENFTTVDYHYTLQAARLAEKQGVKNFLTVTAMGANEKSNIFYNRVKGEVERDLQKLDINGIHIFRPSLLLGERQEFRMGEKMGEGAARLFSFLFIGPLRKYKAIYGKQVALGMYVTALQNKPGIHIYESDSIQEMK